MRFASWSAVPLAAVVSCAGALSFAPSARAGSVGKVERGRLVGAAALPLDGPHHYVLPRRHKWRGLRYATPELVAAIQDAAAAVAQKLPGARLGVGNLSRKRGGKIRFSHSHQSGRDADLAFYMTNARGAPVPPRDLVHFGPSGRSRRGGYRFDVARNWALVEALLTSTKAHVQWLLISDPLKQKLLAHARRIGAPRALVRRAEDVLHQPRWALPHDDHLHLRIYCPDADRVAGCRDTGPMWPWIAGAMSSPVE